MKHSFCGILIMFFVCTAFHCAQAQEVNAAKTPRNKTAFYLGIGGGLDYGGFGFKASFEPIPHLSIFGGGGHNTVSIAGNAGLTINLLPEKKLTPTILAMYGYNSVLAYRTGGLFSTVSQYEMSTGFSAGAGIDFKWGPRPQKLSFAVLYPFRSSDFMSWYILSRSTETLLPVLFSLGWNFNILVD